MAKDYIEHRDGVYFLVDSRVSLESIVQAYLRGESPEGIAESFPAVNLEQIFGALTFYAAIRIWWAIILSKAVASSRPSVKRRAGATRFFTRNSRKLDVEVRRRRHEAALPGRRSCRSRGIGAHSPLA